MSGAAPRLEELNERSRTIFRQLVETYLETGEPVGSRTLSRGLAGASDLALSAATIRNVMQDLEHMGLLDSPHVSAGRVPTELGLRLFVDGVLEIGDVSAEERLQIEREMTGRDHDLSRALDHAGTVLSGLSHCASLVLAPKNEAPIRHIEFVSLSAEKTMAILVMQDGTVENRLFDTPDGLTPSAMRMAANFLNARFEGRTLGEAQRALSAEMNVHRAELDELAASLVERGLALWSGGAGSPERLIVRGFANLLDASQGEDMERMRRLFDDLEKKRDLAQLLDLAEDAEGVRVFIGSENKLFSLSGSSLVVSPYADAERRIVGAIGVIGPTRLNYGRVVPIVDFTARLIGRMVSGSSAGSRGGTGAGTRTGADRKGS